MSYFTKPIDTESITLEALLARCVKTNNGCLEYRVGTDKNGYGRVTINKIRYRASRAVCQLVYGQPQSNQQALHSCDNPPCINPDHLRWGTVQENHKDRVIRNRSVGSIQGVAKYSEADVYQIRLMLASGADSAEVRAKFNLHHSTFFNIRHYKTWKHVTLSDAPNNIILLKGE